MRPALESGMVFSAGLDRARALKGEPREGLSHLNTFLQITYLFEKLPLFRNLQPVIVCKSSSATISASGTSASDPLWRRAALHTGHLLVKQVITRAMVVAMERGSLEGVRCSFRSEQRSRLVRACPKRQA